MSRLNGWRHAELFARVPFIRGLPRLLRFSLMRHWTMLGQGTVDSRSVMLLVKDSDCSAYDCEFVALVRQLGTSLVAMDSKLLRAFPEIARALDAAR